MTARNFAAKRKEEAAARIVKLVKDEGLRTKMGLKAMESVRKRFLMTCLVEQYLDLLNSFEVNYSLGRG